VSEQERDPDAEPAAEQAAPPPEAPVVDAPAALATPAVEVPAGEATEAAERAPAALATPAVEAPAGEATRPSERAPAAPGPIGDRPPRGEGGERRRRPFGRRKVCSFCVEKAKEVDYKDAMKLRRYLSDRGRIESRRKTGTCAKHQRWLATALKRARHLAMLPYSPEHVRSSGAPAGRR
jgi:small subunit ribosomal protein S18